MIPIYEQGDSQGIGHSLDTMISRFIEICNEHKAQNRASAFTFLFYDFTNSPIRDVLKSRGGFARLDRLSGKHMSIFYLHSEKPETIESFHQIFHQAFNVSEKTKFPFVLFFNVKNNDVANIEIVELEQNNPMFAFDELHGLLECRIKSIQTNEEVSSSLTVNRLFPLTSKEISKIGVAEFVKLVFNKAYQTVLNSNLN